MRRMIIVGVLAATAFGGALGAVSAFPGHAQASSQHNTAKPDGSQWI